MVIYRDEDEYAEMVEEDESDSSDGGDDGDSEEENGCADGCLRGLMFSSAVVLFWMGLCCSGGSLLYIDHMRDIERTPEVDNESIISGEVHVTGRVEPLDSGELLTAPETDTETLYYRHVIERREEDSDGNERWRTVSSQSNAVDFMLVDDTGEVQISATDSSASFDMWRSYRDERGNRRYTEYRLDPGRSIFVMGYAEPASDGYRIGFERSGNYRPLIARGDAEMKRVEMAEYSVLAVVLGVTALLFAIFLVMLALRVHHTALYLGVTTVVVVLSLGAPGLGMIVYDLRNAEEALERRLQEGEDSIAEILEAENVDWDGDIETLGSLDEPKYADLSDDQRQRIRGIRVMLAQSILRNNASLNRFPERFIGPVVGVNTRQLPELPPEERQQISELEADFSPARVELWQALVALLIGVAGVIYGTRRGLKYVLDKRLIENIPTSPTSGVVYGVTELKGEVALRDDDYLTAPLSRQRCVYYERRDLEERTRGSGDNERTRWVTVNREVDRTPFLCRDDHGEVAVDPGGASLLSSAEETVNTGQGGSSTSYSVERAILPGTDLYILGSAAVDPETHDELIVGDHDDDDLPFIISSSSEDELMYDKAGKGFMRLNIGIIATMVAGVGVAGMTVSIGPMLYLTTAAISLGYLIVILGFLYYNDLVFLRDRVDRNWANIDVALKKRFDLIDNLSEVVQQLLGHEKQLQQRVAEARQAREAADGDSPDHRELNAEARAVERLEAVVESYPELRSQDAVETLMDSLREVENDIAFMRQGYNDSVERYNSRVRHIPEIFVAKLTGFQKADFLHGAKSEAG